MENICMIFTIENLTFPHMGFLSIILMIYYYIDDTFITYCTIFEALLLKNDEDSQRKKVAARAACITCDTLKFQCKILLKGNLMLKF